MKSEFIGRKMPVNNQGWIMLTDVMGSDHDIAEAARTSFGHDREAIDPEKDNHLIRYLMRHGHTTPFEMAELKFLVYVPMDTWRQWIRHRTASVNEYSTRYAVAIDEMYEAPEWRLQSQNNKQGSDGVLPEADAAELSEAEKKFHQAARELYKTRLEKGVAREQARKDLPLCTFTRAYWKIDLKNLLNFLRLRLEEHAQKEIRDYARVIARIVSDLFPMTMEAFSEYQFNAVTFSASEIRMLPFWYGYCFAGEESLDGMSGYIPYEWKQERCRERDEFFEKTGLPDTDEARKNRDNFVAILRWMAK
ncbi:MAG: FAD-dependent thymidylate synthase [Thermoguttaceae bacterium]|nr:FAD-dependent thymidylate synthase [Thermoguttaceae bacterium]